MRRSLVTSAVLVAACAVGLATAPPASAAQSFSLSTPGASAYYGDGHAVSSGSITFYKADNRVLVNASLDDVCQSGTTGDGYSARLALAVVYTDGSKADHLIGEDDRGCTKTPLSVTFNHAYPKPVRKAQFVLYEYGSSTGVVGDGALSAWKDNPHT